MTDNNTYEQKSLPDIAGELLGGLMSHDIPEDLKDKLRDWFKSGVREPEKYMALKRLFMELKENSTPDSYDYECLRKIHKLLGMPDIDNPFDLLPAGNVSSSVFGIRLRAVVKALVVPAIILAGSVYLWMTWNARSVGQLLTSVVSIVAEAETQKQVILPDSSKVWLNGSSNISFAEDFNVNRIVELNGEAYFSVSKSDVSPFTVKAGNITAMVLGTEFNVKAYGDESESEIVLESGSVDVMVGNRNYSMRPNDKLVVGKHNDEVRLEVVGESDKASWRKGLDFKNVPLREVLTAISSHFNMNIDITGQFPEDNITFGFDHDASPEQVFSVLKATLGYFSYEITPSSVKVSFNRN